MFSIPTLQQTKSNNATMPSKHKFFTCQAAFQGQIINATKMCYIGYDGTHPRAMQLQQMDFLYIIKNKAQDLSKGKIANMVSDIYVFLSG